MTGKRWPLLGVAVIAVSLGIFTLKGFGREQKFEDGQDIKIISEKIEEVLKNQQDIVARLKDIRKELDIIRVRASR